MEQKIKMPVFDITMIKSMTEEELNRYGKQYTEEVAAYVQKSLADELQPVIEEMEKREREALDRQAVEELKDNKDFYDFTEKLEQVQSLIGSLPILAQMDTKCALTVAYLMIKGAQAISEHKEPSEENAQTIADRIYENTEVMKLLSERRAKEAAQDLPVFAKTAGIAANVKKKPKTLADAREEAQKYFKL
ncbi:MAG: hypothetical protein HFE77_05800 [Clostridiales bacterium]|nr:hypothetical protein [Clostridiales bacterium]